MDKVKIIGIDIIYEKKGFTISNYFSKYINYNIVF